MITQACAWVCPSPYEGQLVEGWFVEYLGEWVLIGGRVLTQCGEPPCLLATPVPPGGDGNPCRDADWTSDGVQCEGNYGAIVSAAIPCCRVERAPYPRGLVTQYNFFTIDCPQEEQWSQTALRNPPAGEPGHYPCASDANVGHVANYKIGLLWTRVPGYLAEWDFDDGSERMVGDSVYHIYESSSYGRPQNGVGLNGQPLPAYQVGATTLWRVFSRETYQVCECVSSHQECTCGYDSDGDRSGCDCGEGWMESDPHYYNRRRTVCDAYNWVTHDTGWKAIDLSPWIGTWYAVSSKTGPKATGLEPNPPCGVVPVPVIEVQGVIKNP